MMARKLIRRSALDRLRNCGIMNIEKGAADRRLAPWVFTRSKPHEWGLGAVYFFFVACKTRLIKLMITRQSCKTSDVLITHPPFHTDQGAKKLPPERGGLTAYRIMAAPWFPKKP